MNKIIISVVKHVIIFHLFACSVRAVDTFFFLYKFSLIEIWCYFHWIEFENWLLLTDAICIVVRFTSMLIPIICLNDPFFTFIILFSEYSSVVIRKTGNTTNTSNYAMHISNFVFVDCISIQVDSFRQRMKSWEWSIFGDDLLNKKKALNV